MSEDREWMNQAACLGADPDLFFSEGRGAHTPRDVRRAKAVCHGCEVREVCLDYALTNGEKFGVWGATTPQERRRIRKGRRAA